jgi:hypothetical protein
VRGLHYGSAFCFQIAKAADDVAKTVSAGEHLVDNGFAPDTAATREQVELLRRQLGRLEERAKSREDDLNSALSRLELFYQIHTAVTQDIAEVNSNFVHYQSIISFIYMTEMVSVISIRIVLLLRCVHYIELNSSILVSSSVTV